MGKIIKAEKRGGGGGIESKVIEEYTPLYKTGINCYNVLEYIHNNNTFIMLLTKIVIELYVTNVYCSYDSN